MITIFILTMLFQSGHGYTTITQEYTSQAKCEAAKQTIRQALEVGNVRLATCTQK